VPVAFGRGGTGTGNGQGLLGHISAPYGYSLNHRT
jgi:hypothetical protein